MNPPFSVFRLDASNRFAYVCAWCNRRELVTGQLTGDDWAKQNDLTPSHGICRHHAEELTADLPKRFHPAIV